MPQCEVYLVKPLSGRLSRAYSFNARNDGEAEDFVRERQTAGSERDVQRVTRSCDSAPSGSRPMQLSADSL